MVCCVIRLENKVLLLEKRSTAVATIRAFAILTKWFSLTRPALVTPIMAGYPPPVAFDAATAAAVAASMGVQAGVPGSPAQGAVDMQHLYKFAGQAVSGFSPQLHDPIYLQQYMCST
jgi:hypothetical protein